MCRFVSQRCNCGFGSSFSECLGLCTSSDGRHWFVRSMDESKLDAGISLDLDGWVRVRQEGGKVSGCLRSWRGVGVYLHPCR